MLKSTQFHGDSVITSTYTISDLGYYTTRFYDILALSNRRRAYQQFIFSLPLMVEIVWHHGVQVDSVKVQSTAENGTNAKETRSYKNPRIMANTRVTHHTMYELVGVWLEKG